VNYKEWLIPVVSAGLMLCAIGGMWLHRESEKEVQALHVSDPVQPAKRFSTNYFSQKNLSCLTEAIFHEAGMEPDEGKEAVGIVILNRAEQRNTDNLCSVIAESSIIDGKKVCQFSYYCMNHFDHKKMDGPVLASTALVAALILNNRFELGAMKLFRDATHYHADYITTPLWAKKMVFLGQIGVHKFYKKEATTNGNTK
jgi:spore germination cell wall hydrolase CwlJ-like protein